MYHKIIECENNKSIHIFDDVVDFHYKNNTFTFIKNSRFRIGWSDREDTKVHEYVYSTYTMEEYSRVNPIIHCKDDECGQTMVDALKQKRWTKTMVNLSTQTEPHFIHTHDGITLLYYVNLDWDESFGGETIFYKEDLSEIVYTSKYTPGRIIIFDGTIPHTFRAQSSLGPRYRFTMATIYN